MKKKIPTRMTTYEAAEYCGVTHATIIYRMNKPNPSIFGDWINGQWSIDVQKSLSGLIPAQISGRKKRAITH